MTVTKEPKSDYNFHDWEPIRVFPDLVPVVGALTWSERVRKERRLSVREFYLAPFSSPKTFVTLGLENLSEPKDAKAVIRQSLLIFRNCVFASYHTVLPLITYLHLR